MSPYLVQPVTLECQPDDRRGRLGDQSPAPQGPGHRITHPCSSLGGIDPQIDAADDAAPVGDGQAGQFRPVGLDLDLHITFGVLPGVGDRHCQEAAKLAIPGVFEHVIDVGGFKGAQDEPLGVQRYRRLRTS